jgi:hypothetical protein
MQRVARTIIRAASAGVGAVVARKACGSTSVAPAGGVASARLLASATFKASASSLRLAQRPTCGHRRLTTHSSGRAARAAKFGR